MIPYNDDSSSSHSTTSIVPFDITNPRPLQTILRVFLTLEQPRLHESTTSDNHLRQWLKTLAHCCKKYVGFEPALDCQYHTDGAPPLKADKTLASASGGFSLFGGREEKYQNAADLYIQAANAFRMQKSS